MLLVKKDVVASKSKINVSFEKVADDLLMISLVNQEYKGIPSYWRLTKVVGIPPLELGIDCQEGFILNATFFVDGFTVKKGRDVDVPLLDGTVLVDAKIFTRVNEYIDVEQTYDIYCCRDKLICSFKEVAEIEKAFKDDRVEVFVDCNDQIIGFSICDLSEDERNLIHSIAGDIN